MKKSLLAVALLGAFASVAQAQTAVQIYGTVDAGVTKRSDQTLAAAELLDPFTHKCCYTSKNTKGRGNSSPAMIVIQPALD